MAERVERLNRRWFLGGALAAGGVAGLTAALELLHHGRAGRPANAGITIFRGGTLIDGTGASPLPNAAVVVQGRSILGVGRAVDIPVPRGAKVIDAPNKWIIPGLVDFHVHMHGANDARSLLAYGITTVRDCGKTFGELDRVMQDAASDEIPSPSVFGCGPLLTGDPPLVESISDIVTSADEATTAVDRIAGRRFQWVKTGVNLPPELAKVIIDHAHERGLRVTMHASLPRGTLELTTQAKAIELGIDSLEHALLAISEIASRSPAPTTSRFRWVHFWKAWADADMDAPKTQQHIQAAVAKKIAWTPTLAVAERQVRADQSDVTSTPAFRLERSHIEAVWSGALWSQGWGPDELAIGQAGFERHVQFTGRLHAAGVNLLAGSDINNPYVIPGVSLHRELELLVQAGLSPMEAIQAATAKPAEALGQGAAIGTLEAGKQADLVILGADPLASIGSVGHIERVMRLGRLYRPDELLSPRTGSVLRPAALAPARFCC